MKVSTQQRVAKRAGKKRLMRRQYSEVAAPQTSSKKTIYVWCLVLAVVAFAVYSPAIRHPFVNYDDYDYVTQNPHLQGGLTADTIAWAFSSTDRSEERRVGK